MSYTITKQETLVTEECCTCGVSFAMPQMLQQQRRKDKDWFYCPNGHAQAYSRNEADRLRDELASVRAKLDQAQADANWQKKAKELAEQERENARRALANLSKRVKNGVCPCCGRTFKNVQRHMASKHPNEAGKMCPKGIHERTE